MAGDAPTHEPKRQQAGDPIPSSAGDGPNEGTTRRQGKDIPTSTVITPDSHIDSGGEVLPDDGWS